MKLKYINIDNTDFQKKGIKEASLSFRSNKTIFVGKNGSGKTRTLDLITNKIKTKGEKVIRQNPDQFESIPNYLKKAINENQNKANEYLNSLILYIKPDLIQKMLAGMERNMNQGFVGLDRIIEKQPNSYLENELELITQSSIIYFQNLPTQIILKATEYVTKSQSDFKKTKVYQQYISLNEKFERFLGKKLEYRINHTRTDLKFNPDGSANGVKGGWLLNNYPFNYRDLSDGEKTLFAYILLFYFKEQYAYSKTKNSIIIIDEPEIHLHADAQIQLIEGLIELIKEDGQLILASHSVSILSLFNDGEIFLVKNNEILTPTSSLPKDAVDELLNFSNQEKYLTTFLKNINEWAYRNFMLLNFENPSVIESSSPEDPQFIQFVEFLESNNYNFLDFGCGLGRLEKLIEANDSIKKKFQKVDVFEREKKFHKELGSITIVNKIFSNINEFEGNYNIILLSNVLHEIKPTEWVKNLNKIISVLDPNGYLILMEDLELRNGEAPNEFGYLVLNSDEAKTLFNYQSEPIIINPKSEKYKDRLMCAVFRKDHIGHINKLHVKRSIEQLQKRTLDKLMELRIRKTFQEGRSYAFYSQQYINCIYTLPKL